MAIPLSKRRYSRDDLIDVGRQCRPILDFKKIQHAACIDLMSARPRFKADPMSFPSVKRLVPTSGPSLPYTYSSESSEAEPRSDLDGKGQRWPQYQLRARRNTISSSEQPNSAPPGIDSQHDENFRLFYEAVASPSHVRVTAGGRIVPNYNKPPPVYKYNDNRTFDADNASSLAIHGPTFSIPEQPLNSRNNLLSETCISHFERRPEPDRTISNSNHKDFAYKMANQNQFVGDQHFVDFNAIKVSSPTQFDPTKPYAYGGRMVFPGQASTFVPYPIFANGGMFSNMVNHPSSVGQAAASTQPTAPGYSLNIGDSQQDQHGAPSASMLPTAASPLKEHMQTLKDTANFLQQQLECNQDHIDVDIAKTQLEQTQKQIEALEYGMSIQPLQSIFKVQPVYAQDEESDKSEDRASEEFASQASPLIRVESPDFSLNDIIAAVKADDMADVASSVASTVEQGLRPARAFRRSHAIPIVADNATTSQPTIRGTRLPPTAARAPEFKPSIKPNSVNMAQIMAVTDATSTQVTNARAPILNQATESNSSYTAQISPWNADLSQPIYGTVNGQVQRLMPLVVSNQNGVPTFLQVPPAPKAHSHNGYNSVMATPGGNSQSRSVTHLDTVSQENAMRGPVISEFGGKDANDVLNVPYLLGFTPSGFHGPIDPLKLLYSRPLTDSEKRAREIYWGKVPKEAGIGLPKFDGRDFWVASPQKSNVVQPQTDLRPLPANWDLNPSESAFLAELEHNAANGITPFATQPDYNAFGSQPPSTIVGSMGPPSSNVGSMRHHQPNYGPQSRHNSQASMMSMPGSHMSQSYRKEVVGHDIKSAPNGFGHTLVSTQNATQTQFGRAASSSSFHFGAPAPSNSFAQASDTTQNASQTKFGRASSSSSFHFGAPASYATSGHSSHRGSELGHEDALQLTRSLMQPQRSSSESKSYGRNMANAPPPSTGNFFQGNMATAPSPSTGNFFHGLQRPNMPRAVGAAASSLCTETATAQHLYGWPRQDVPGEDMRNFSFLGTEQGLASNATVEDYQGSPSTYQRASDGKQARATTSITDLFRLALRDAPGACNRASPDKGPVSGGAW